MSKAVQSQVDSVETVTRAGSRLGVGQFLASRVAAAAGAVLAYAAASMDGGPQVLAAGALLLLGAGAVVLVQMLGVRAAWHREPGKPQAVWGGVAGGAVDAVVLVLLALALTRLPVMPSTFPAAAIVKATAVTWFLVLAWGAVRGARGPVVADVVQLVVVGAGAVGAWLLADQLVPIMWRAEQALVCAAVAVVVAAGVIAFGYLVRRKMV